ncbi:MAG: endo-1,4-beta-xylanase, partial [Phycisphaerae bacterium]
MSFAVYSNGQPATTVNLSGAYLLGTDDVPLRAEITFQDGVITCRKRAAGPAGLALLWDVPGVGTIMLDTIRVPEREKPYTLQLELARARLTRINQKTEDWGLLDFVGMEDVVEEIEQARNGLIRALQADDLPTAAALGNEALALAVKASESLSRRHADVLFERRKQMGAFPKRVLGCAIPLDRPTEAVRKRLVAATDFVTVPIAWRDLEPSEQTFNWKPLDTWVELLSKHHIPMKGASLLSFSERHVPDWLYIYEHDFEAVRDFVSAHIGRVVQRYADRVPVWDAISGIHACNTFHFNFEQLMELTRMCPALIKQFAPRAVTLIDIVAPWGEYYSRNPRTIPPMLYAEMIVQNNVQFDAFGVQIYVGLGLEGMYVRDMFQISS